MFSWIINFFKSFRSSAVDKVIAELDSKIVKLETVLKSEAANIEKLQTYAATKIKAKEDALEALALAYAKKIDEVVNTHSKVTDKINTKIDDAQAAVSKANAVLAQVTGATVTALEARTADTTVVITSNTDTAAITAAQ